MTKREKQDQKANFKVFIFLALAGCGLKLAKLVCGFTRVTVKAQFVNGEPPLQGCVHAESCAWLCLSKLSEEFRAKCPVALGCGAALVTQFQYVNTSQRNKHTQDKLKSLSLQSFCVDMMASFM